LSAENSRSQRNDRSSWEEGMEQQVLDQEFSPDAQPGLHPDVDLDVPMLQVEEIDLEVEDLQVHVSLQAQLADFVKLSAGVNAHLGRVKLAIKGVEAQARLKVRLEGVLNTLTRALDTIDANPQVLGAAARGAGQLGGQTQRTEETMGGPSHAEGNVSEQDMTEQTEDRGDESAGEVKATDAARRKAEELGIDLSRVEGTGAGGRILVGDVKRAAG
jgi:pyruvate/2-oxoglutarate dehydrogenase complex dihydrolipoamide acyltransferase (E2) component